MPHFRLETNVPKEKIPPNFAKELNQLISKILGRGKPEEICAVTIVPDQWMVHGKEDGPCGQAVFICVDRFSPQSNIGFSRALSEKISEIGIPSDRLYILFSDVKSCNIGYAGTTGHEVCGPTGEKF